jgi:hypothetical protein
VLLQALRATLPIWPAIWITSLLFGAVHALNVFVTGELAPALLQALTAMMSGLLFIAIRLRTGSLVPAIVVHGLWDFGLFATLAASSPTAQPGEASAAMNPLAPTLLVLPNFLYGLWLLRGIGRASPVQAGAARGPAAP